MHIYLIRGAAGSGKSYLAEIISYFQDYVHLEADMYFVDKNGKYNFDRTKLAEAHKWCQDQTEKILEDGGRVVVANTFVKKWEMQAYKDLADKYGAKVTEIIVSGNFESVHNVPKEVVDRMKSNFEY